MWYGPVESASVLGACLVLLCLEYGQATYAGHTRPDGHCMGCPDGSCDDHDGLYRCVVPCNAGSYGRSCQHHCPSRCSDGTCNTMLGTCDGCSYGYHGLFCNMTCSSGCSTRSDQKCYQVTGECISACHLGFYGQTCDKPCPDHCHLSCNRDNGSCFVCDSRYWGEFCNTTCAPNCFMSCEQTTGSCPVCNSGWRGATCHQPCSVSNCESCTRDDECFVCKEGWYGLKCDQMCSPYCQSSSCDRRTGNCDCQTGWFGEQCNQPCIAHCSLCGCNQTCTLCEDGYYGSNCEKRCPRKCQACLRSGLKCTECKNDDRFGHKCSCSFTECEERKTATFECISCAKVDWFPFGNGCCPCTDNHCLESNYCNSYSAACSSGCETGYYGVMCTEKCSRYCKGGSGRCHGNLGHCHDRCRNGWYGKRCDASYCLESYPHCIACAYRQKPYSAHRNDLDCTECEPGYYITNGHCEKCMNCKDQMCRSYDGICLEGCIKGWYLDTVREYCTRKCGHCINEICHAINGTCINGCQPGYYGHTCTLHCPRNCKYATCNSTGMCSEGCTYGFYGKYCYDVCERCLHDVCNHVTGICIKCKPQWHGVDCGQSCDGCVQGVCTVGQGCAEGCWPGLYGISCNMTCPDKVSCYACDQLTGQCIVCKNNLGSPLPVSCHVSMGDVTWTEAYRKTSCEAGYYGADCSTECPDYCRADVTKGHHCDRFTGTCLPIDGCYPGYFGQHCDRICVNCRHGQCERTTGECMHGCAKGWSGAECINRLESAGETNISLLFTTVAVLGAVGVGLLILLLCFVCCTSSVHLRGQNSKNKGSSTVHMKHRKPRRRDQTNDSRGRGSQNINGTTYTKRTPKQENT